jgi:hypothetical protein
MAEPLVRPGWLRWRREPVEGIRQPRVVLECGDGAKAAQVARTLANAGYDVTVCNGPSGHDRCVLADGTWCGAVEKAEVVLNLLDADTPEQADVESLVRRRYPSVPVVVGVTRQARPGP